MTLTAAQRGALLRDPAGWLATGLGAGLSPVAPGTVGSAAALLPWLALRGLPWWGYLVAMVFTFVVGIWAAQHAIERLRVQDPGCIVIDEFVGQWLSLFPLLLQPRGWPWMVAGFALFRLFDVCKPWPVSWADREVKGGLGVMLDDALAGGMAALTLALASFVIG